MATYAIADIHGALAPLNDALARIPNEPCEVVFLGDYVDRGRESKQVIDRLLNLPPHITPIFLMGNHEEFMLRALNGDSKAHFDWLMNGGQATIDSYGGEENIPPEHMKFLRGLKLTHRLGKYFFCHAGIRPGVPLDKQEPKDLLWIRSVFLMSDADHGAIIVHGHTPNDELEEEHNRINLDTLAYKNGYLAIMGTDGTRHWFIS